jgi:hypothetical protein
MNFTKHFNLKQTPQSQAIPGTAQVGNSNAGFSWAVDDWTRLDRFLILGTEGGTFYATEAKLTRDAAAGVLRCIAADGLRVVRRIVEVSAEGRAPRMIRRCSRSPLRRSSARSTRGARRTRPCRRSLASERTSSTLPST